MELVLSAGAEDMSAEGEKYEVITPLHDFEAVRQALEKAKIPAEAAQLTMIPKNITPVTPESARAVIRLTEALEDHDDVQHVYFNCDIPDEVLKENL